MVVVVGCRYLVVVVYMMVGLGWCIMIVLEEGYVDVVVRCNVVGKVDYGKVDYGHGMKIVRHGVMIVRHGVKIVRHAVKIVRHGVKIERHGMKIAGRTLMLEDPLVPTSLCNFFHACFS
jgi:hypothetical protein